MSSQNPGWQYSGLHSADEKHLYVIPKAEEKILFSWYLSSRGQRPPGIFLKIKIT
jgi:hypothetical protein